MASRQNRKKKGRASQQNRERTVTTLTSGETQSEEPAALSMSSPFSVSSSSGGVPNNNIPNGNFPVSGNFAYPGSFKHSYLGSMHASNQQYQSSQQFCPQPTLPSGKDDLEILEKLKAQIKSGKHNTYRPEPQPRALLKVYQDGLLSEVPTYSQQDGAGYQGPGSNRFGYDVGSATGDAGTKAALPTDANRRLPRIQTKDVSDMSDARRSVESSPKMQTSLSGRHSPKVPLSPSNKQGPDSHTTADAKSSAEGAGSDATQPHGRFGSSNANARGQDPGDQKIDHRLAPGDSPVGEYNSKVRPEDGAVKQPLYDNKDGRSVRDLAWHPREGPATQDDKRSRPELDRPGPPFGGPDSRTNGNDPDTRGPGPRDQRFHDRGDHDRDRDDRDRDRDWNRDKQQDFRRDDRHRMPDTRRPPPDRHYEPRHPVDTARRSDSVLPADDTIDIDKRPLLSPVPRPSIEDRLPVGDDRVPLRAPPSDSRSAARVPPVDEHHIRPPGENRHTPSANDRNVRPAQLVQPMEDVVAPRLTDRGARAPLAPVDDRGTRPAIPLEDRIGRPPPSLQERITHPPPSRADDRPGRQPSLEERISHPPPVSSDRSVPDDRVIRPNTADRPARPVVRTEDRSVRPGPPGDRYARSATPAQDRGPRGPSYGAIPPSTRDDLRALRSDPSPPYRPVRALSRERDLRPPHRPDGDRAYDVDRRSDLLDIDPPPRFSDNRPGYRRPTSPPPPSDRAKNIYPLSSSPSVEPIYTDPDRRYAAGDRRDWQYEDRQRQWSGTDDEHLRMPRPASWDRDAPPPVRNGGWEERERRTFPGSPSARSFDSTQQRPLSTRLTDYSGPNDDRVYGPRDPDRTRYPPPPIESTGGPFSRVRPRSPSPINRRPGGLMEDDRPPIKRAREDAYSSGYYPPSARRPSISSGPGDYPPRPVPAPSTGGGAYYDSRAGPPPASGGRNNGGPAYDRDYPGMRDRGPDAGGYAPGPGYDRPLRSPPPSRVPPLPYNGRGNYARPGGDPRDDRRYNNIPPPPPRSN